VPIEDVELLEALEDRMDIEEARKALKEKETVPWEIVKKERSLIVRKLEKRSLQLGRKTRLS